MCPERGLNLYNFWIPSHGRIRNNEIVDAATTLANENNLILKKKLENQIKKISLLSN